MVRAAVMVKDFNHEFDSHNSCCPVSLIGGWGVMRVAAIRARAEQRASAELAAVVLSSAEGAESRGDALTARRHAPAAALRAGVSGSDGAASTAAPCLPGACFALGG